MSKVLRENICQLWIVWPDKLSFKSEDNIFKPNANDLLLNYYYWDNLLTTIFSERITKGKGSERRKVDTEERAGSWNNEQRNY